MSPVRNQKSPVSKKNTNGVEKSQLRNLMRDRLISQSEEERSKKSFIIKQRLFSLSEFKRSKVVMFYVSIDTEVGTSLMVNETLKMGKKVAVPLMLTGEKKIVASLILDPIKELKPGPYGISQPDIAYFRPVSLNEIDLVIVPGLAFDKQGNRLGRGKGYYDRFLNQIPRGIPLVGLAFAFQIVDRLSVFPHDLPVTKVITD